MSRAIVKAERIGAHDALVLENEHLRTVILPALGGRVWTLEDRVRGRQWIWHREGVPLRAQAPGASYDDVWAGGWEELFPNDAAGTFEGRDLTDHGEWWTMAFSAASQTSGTAATVSLRAMSRIIRAECMKVFSLPNDDAALTVTYRIRSLEPEPFHFLFKQHLPIHITPACRLALPGGRTEEVDPTFGTIMQGAGPCPWPGTKDAKGRIVDLRLIPPASGQAREFLYVRNLPAPWCGVDDLEHSALIRMEYDGRQVPFVWLFLSYGGWRDAYTVVLEPCTNLPKDLKQAVRLGQSARLAPGEAFETNVTVRLGGLQETTA